MNKAFTRYATTSFLLLVFSLNTLLGFACGAGWNLGFNAGNHQHEKSAEQHQASKKISAHHHPDSDDHQKPAESKEDKDDCCTENVLTISMSDKSVPKSVEKINPVYSSLFTVADFFVLTSPGLYNTKNSSSYLIPGHHPPIADIRIAIRSFQI